MKNVVLFSLIFMLFACNSVSLSAYEEAEIEQEILGRFDSLAESVKRLDKDAYFAHFNHRLFTALNENGTVTQKFEQFQQHFSSGIGAVASYDELSFKRVKVTVIDANNVILVNEYNAQVNLKNGSKVAVSGAGTQVWHRSEGNWLLVSVSSSTK